MITNTCDRQKQNKKQIELTMCSLRKKKEERKTLKDKLHLTYIFYYSLFAITHRVIYNN